MFLCLSLSFSPPLLLRALYRSSFRHTVSTRIFAHQRRTRDRCILSSRFPVSTATLCFAGASHGVHPVKSESWSWKPAKRLRNRLALFDLRFIVRSPFPPPPPPLSLIHCRRISFSRSLLSRIPRSLILRANNPLRDHAFYLFLVPAFVPSSSWLTEPTNHQSGSTTAQSRDNEYNRTTNVDIRRSTVIET